MARMHSRKKGKAGSKKPMVPAQWVVYKPEEVERLVVKLSKDGLSTALIGRTLRDQYGIPSVRAVSGKTVSKIVEENGMVQKVPEDLMNLLKKTVKLREHLSKNKKDSTSKRGLELLESKVRRLVKYYVKRKRLPAQYRYNPERVKLTVQTGEL